ncbi:hypothetical protein OG625_13940 [Streptomyces sp. NBC_01351]|uniref:hypothetical protein n=1 Tax=Streptomyces sp. NBC_01351 TaxID=2903833 RepID=UPI002E373880|nr:hypothetical protein [Streptomyces sp. NBC_01351]
MIIMVALTLVIAPLQGSADSFRRDDPDPTTIPLPLMDDDDPAKAVVARVTFASRTQATVDRTSVSLQRAHTHIGDPPILKLSLTDVDGQVIDRMNAWSPLWAYSHGDRERVDIKAGGSGSFIVPFSPALSTMTITDSALNRDVVTVDVKPAIRAFCVSHPSDPDCLESDLSVDAVEPRAPLFAVLGKPVTVTVASTVSNAGPDGPTDARVERTVTAGTGVTVTPDTPETTEVALAVGTPQRLEKTYTVTCTQPGARTLDFTTAVAPERASVIDPQEANNRRTTRLTVDCAVPITINIQPGSTRNPVNLNGAVLPVAALTTRAGEYGNPIAFNATGIDAASLRFASPSVLLLGGGVPEIHSRIHPENSLEPDEVTRDGDTDAVLHFRPRSDALTPTDTSGCVLGRFAGPSGPLSFYGCDSVTIAP